MSGLDQLKQKAKLSLDEMYVYENEMVGNTTNQKVVNPENKPSVNPSIQPLNSMIEEINSNPLLGADFDKKQNADEKHTTFSEKQELRKLESWKPSPVTNQKPNVYKMTFNLSEKSYKEFNDLYAKRMLKGCKTEKSELISEAIDWLVKMEN